MFSSRELEGYMEIDHRNSPGFTCEEAHRAGWGRIAHELGKGQIAKVPVANCGHCQKHVIMNPMRTRERARCWKCWSYLCDNCKIMQVASGGDCKPFAQIVDEFIDWASKKRS